MYPDQDPDLICLLKLAKLDLDFDLEKFIDKQHTAHNEIFLNKTVRLTYMIILYTLWPTRAYKYIPEKTYF